MTASSSRKLRGVFLAALMVFSVMAVASPATAAVTTADRSLSTTSVAPGGSVQASLTVEFNQDHDSVSIQDQLDVGAVESIDSLSWSGDSDTGEVFAQVVDQDDDGTDDGVTVALDGVDAGETLTVSYTVNVASDASDGDTIVFTGVSGDDVVAGDDTAELGSDTVFVSADEDGDENTPTPTPAPGEPDHDADLEDGGTYWAGQILIRSDDVNAGETMELRAATSDGDAGNLIRQIPDSDNDGTVTLDTASLEGSYVLEDSDNNIVASFEVVPQDLTISWDDNTVQNAGDSTTVDLEFDSNRGTYDVNLTASNLSADDLQDIFGGTQTDDGVHLSGLTSDETVTADFDGIDADSYDITASVPDTTASSTDSIQVNAPGDITASFSDATVQEDRGDTLSFTVNLQNTDSVSITVGSDDVNYAVDLVLTDGDDDGEVTVNVDTLAAGNVADEDAVYSTADADDSVTADRTTAQLDNPLSTGSYDLSLTVNGEEKAIGSFYLRDRTTTSMSIWTAPGDENIEELDDIESLLGMESGGLTQTSEVTVGDWLIVQVQASGVYAYLDGVDDFEQDGLTLESTEQDPGLNQDPDVWTVEAGDNGMILTDPANDQFFYARKIADNPDNAGTEWETEFEISDENSFVPEDESESVTATWSLQDRTGEIDTNTEDETLVVSASNTAMISGETSLAPGTEVTVMVRSEDNQEPFLERVFPTVAADGTWSAAFDLSDLPDGTPLTVKLQEGGEDLATLDAEIGTPPTPTEVDTPTPRVVTVQQPSPTPEVITETVVRQETEIVVETVVTQETVTVTVTDGQPGFGIAVAIVALLAAALLAVRRRD